MGTPITGPADLSQVEGHATMDEFLDHVAGQSDMEVEFSIDDGGVAVEHWGPGQPDQMTFTYPFDSDDMENWVYHVENHNTIRFDIRGDVEDLAERAGVLTEDSPGRNHMNEFVETLLWERHIDLDGTDLLVMDDHGDPAELSATHIWDTPYIGVIIRPYRPHRFQPSVARLYPSGKLALAWAPDLEAPPLASRVLDDLLVVDFIDVDAGEALDLFDEACARFAIDCRWLG